MREGIGSSIAMMVYIISFAVSILLIYYSETKRFRTVDAKICTAIALMLPCILAGLRAPTIGTDVLVYVEPLFKTACSADSFWDFYGTRFYQEATWSYVFVYEFEIGFNILCYICAKFFNSMPLLLLAIQALTVIPIYKGLRAFEKTQPVWLGMTVYYLMFFNNTLNMMRQWIAMAFLFYGFQFLLKKNYRKYWGVVLAAMVFHISAIMAVVVFAVYLLTVGTNRQLNKLRAFFLVSIAIVVLLSLKPLAELMRLLGLRYANYFSGSISFLPRQILYRIPIIFLIVYRWRFLKRSNQLVNFYAVMIAYDLVFSQLISVFVQSGRIGTFFSEYYILAYPAICKASANPGNRRVLRWGVICYLCLYWWYVYTYEGSSATVPYLSIFG